MYGDYASGSALIRRLSAYCRSLAQQVGDLRGLSLPNIIDLTAPMLSVVSVMHHHHYHIIPRQVKAHYHHPDDHTGCRPNGRLYNTTKMTRALVVYCTLLLRNYNIIIIIYEGLARAFRLQPRNIISTTVVTRLSSDNNVNV